MPKNKKPRHKRNLTKGSTNPKGQEVCSKKVSKKNSRWISIKADTLSIKRSTLVVFIALLLSFMVLHLYIGWDIETTVLVITALFNTK